MKKKYTVDLQAQMAECEANYLRLQKLMPDMHESDIREFTLLGKDNQCHNMCIEVVERCKYTTILKICQGGGSNNIGSKNIAATESLYWLSDPAMTVRVYHDAKMAEVISYQQQRHIQAKYDYPNQQMHHKNEKTQLNQFLSEWLGHCLNHGVSNKVISLFNNQP